MDDDVGKKSSSTSNQTGGSPEAASRPVRTVSSRMRNLMRDELLINLHKFESQVNTYNTACIKNLRNEFVGGCKFANIFFRVHCS